MSLLNYFSVNSSKRKRDEEASQTKDQRYDKTKRRRRFLPQWKENWPWVEYAEDDDKMFCTICKKFPDISNGNRMLQGTDNYRIETLKAHEQSSVHKECSTYFRQKEGLGLVKNKEKNLANTAIGASILKMTEEQQDKFGKLFTIAYSLAKYGKPLSDMEFQCRLAGKLDVGLGYNYQNSHGARQFIEASVSVLRAECSREIRKSSFVSVLADGSTDKNTVEQETIFVRYVDSNGKPKTTFCDIVNLEHAHSEGVFSAIDEGLTKLNLSVEDLTNTEMNNIPKLVGVNFDGASVMQGRKSGVVAHFLNAAPHIIPMHCVAHKLELAILDAVKDVPYLQKFEEKVKSIFKFYHYSPKQQRELKSIAAVIDDELAHFSSVKQVRWLASKTRAIKAIRQNFKALCLHLESSAAGRKHVTGNKATNFHREIQTFTFVKTLHVMLDILPVLTSLSKIFQREDLLVTEVKAEVNGTALLLEQLRMEPMSGTYMKMFMEQYQPDERTFGGTRLLDTCPTNFTFTDDTFLNSIVGGILKYIDKRFEIFTEEPIICFEAFDNHTWPTERQKLVCHGNDEVKKLIEHFDSVLTETEKKSIPSEYQLLKGRLSAAQLRQKDSISVFANLLACRPPALQSVLKLVEIMLVISPSTATCERSFSKMNRCKNSFRCSMKQDTLQDLMCIMHEGPELEDFDAGSSITHWMKSGKGTRHISGHKIITKCPAKDIVDME